MKCLNGSCLSVGSWGSTFPQPLEGIRSCQAEKGAWLWFRVGWLSLPPFLGNADPEVSLLGEAEPLLGVQSPDLTLCFVCYFSPCASGIFNRHFIEIRLSGRYLKAHCHSEQTQTENHLVNKECRSPFCDGITCKIQALGKSMAHRADLHKVYKALSTKFGAWAVRSRSGVFRLAETSTGISRSLAKPA